MAEEQEADAAGADAETVEDTEETEIVTEIIEEETEEVIDEEERKEARKARPKPPKKTTSPGKRKQKKKKPPKKKRKKGGKPKKGGKKGKGSTIWMKKRLAAIVESFSPCPHIYFKQKAVDRGKLKPDQYIDLLATPRREPWLEGKEAEDELHPYKRRALTARTECLAIPNKRYVTAHLDEFFDILNDNQKNHLKEILQTECDMTKEDEDKGGEGQTSAGTRGETRKKGDQEGKERGGSGQRMNRQIGKDGRRKEVEKKKAIAKSSYHDERAKKDKVIESSEQKPVVEETYLNDSSKWADWLNKSLSVDMKWASWIGDVIVDGERQAAMEKGVTITDERDMKDVPIEIQGMWTIEIKKNIIDWHNNKLNILQEAHYWDDWKNGSPLPTIGDESETNPEDWVPELHKLIKDALSALIMKEFGIEENSEIEEKGESDNKEVREENMEIENLEEEVEEENKEEEVKEKKEEEVKEENKEEEVKEEKEEDVKEEKEEEVKEENKEEEVKEEKEEENLEGDTEVKEKVVNENVEDEIVKEGSEEDKE